MSGMKHVLTIIQGGTAVIVGDEQLGVRSVQDGIPWVVRDEECALYFVQGGTCVIVGDDAEQVAALSDLAAKEIGCRIYVPHPYHPKGGHSQEKFNDQPLPLRCTQAVQLLADIEILSHTDYMVGSYNSGIPGLVEILRYSLYKKSRLTFADSSAYHRDWAQGIRKYFNKTQSSGKQ
jgi:hypothetical protein